MKPNMKFFPATLLAALLLPGTSAAMTSAQVTDSILAITETSVKNVNRALSSLSITSNVATVSSTGQVVGNGLTSVISTLNQDVSGLQGQAPFADKDARPVADAAAQLVNFMQAMLSNLLNKHAIFAQFGQAASISAVLRSVEAVVDSFAFALAGVLPSQATAVQGGHQALQTLIENAIKQYNELCIPSVLYPQLQPVCAGL
ncbi:hypothetical protein C8R43DRAFT_264475 [Mycena crocata]|nr:hypothetical protein C8R43DRAFT_264475 [Mycena crocata]